MNKKYTLVIFSVFLFFHGYSQIEIPSELEKNVLIGKAESAVKQFQSLLTNLGSNQFDYEQKQSFILDALSLIFENDKIRIANDIEPEGSVDYSANDYLKQISIWFPAPKEVTFLYTVNPIKDIYISDDNSYLFVKAEAKRDIDGINNGNIKIKNSCDIDIYVKFAIINGQIIRRARIYSITRHTESSDFKTALIRKEFKDEEQMVPNLIDNSSTLNSGPLFEAYPLACTKLNCKTFNFKSDDDLYLYFKSGISGYLSVFLDDGKDCFKLLPYSLDTLNSNAGMPVEAQKEYVLFSTEPQFNYDVNKFFIEDSYQLVAENDKDINHLFVVFSKDPLNSIDVQKSTNAKILTETEEKKGYTIPQSLTSAAFQNWIKNRRITTQELNLKDIEVSIIK